MNLFIKTVTLHDPGMIHVRRGRRADFTTALPTCSTVSSMNLGAAALVLRFYYRTVSSCFLNKTQDEIRRRQVSWRPHFHIADRLFLFVRGDISENKPCIVVQHGWYEYSVLFAHMAFEKQVHSTVHRAALH